MCLWHERERERERRRCTRVHRHQQAVPRGGLFALLLEIYVCRWQELNISRLTQACHMQILERWPPYLRDVNRRRLTDLDVSLSEGPPSDTPLVRHLSDCDMKKGPAARFTTQHPHAGHIINYVDGNSATQTDCVDIGYDRYGQADRHRQARMHTYRPAVPLSHRENRTL